MRTRMREGCRPDAQIERSFWFVTMRRGSIIISRIRRRKTAVVVTVCVQLEIIRIQGGQRRRAACAVASRPPSVPFFSAFLVLVADAPWGKSINAFPMLAFERLLGEDILPRESFGRRGRILEFIEAGIGVGEGFRCRREGECDLCAWRLLPIICTEYVDPRATEDGLADGRAGGCGRFK